MKDLLSPKELAAAIGVSESSLRRWVDSGAIRTSRTVGGHRRILLAEAIRFIRASHASVVRPELLGFAALTTPAAAPKNLSAETERLYQALLDGDATLARGVVLSLYLTGSPLPSLFDGPLATAMHRAGELYLHSPKGVLAEHRATDIALQIVARLRELLPVRPAGAPLAMGGTPSEDIYLLPAQMAAATLVDAGYRVDHYGPDVPLNTLAAAAEETRPRLVYLSVTSVPAAERLTARDLCALADRLARANALLVIGGQQVPALRLSPHPNLHAFPTMADLATFARDQTPSRPAN